jgi:membrane protein implicated in regulation of membrane protease activity
MHNILEWLKNAWSIFVAIFFQHPTERFDRINGSNNDSFDGIREKAGLVIQPVSSTSGLVRYSGANWKARLLNNSEIGSIQTGETVCILSAKGNTLLVKESAK